MHFVFGHPIKYKRNGEVEHIQDKILVRSSAPSIVVAIYPEGQKIVKLYDIKNLPESYILRRAVYIKQGETGEQGYSLYRLEKVERSQF